MKTEKCFGRPSEKLKRIVASAHGRAKGHLASILYV